MSTPERQDQRYPISATNSNYSGASTLKTERHGHLNNRRAGLSIAPGMITSPVWSDLPSRITEGRYKTDHSLSQPQHQHHHHPEQHQFHRYAGSHNLQPSFHQPHLVMHPQHDPHVHGTSTSPPVVYPTSIPNWPYHIGPSSSQPVLLRNFNATAASHQLTNTSQQEKRRNRLTFATYMILTALLISASLATVLFITAGHNNNKSSKDESSTTAYSPDSNQLPLLEASSRTGVTPKENASTASSYYNYYYYYGEKKNQTMTDDDVKQTEVVIPWNTQVPSPSLHDGVVPTTTSTTPVINHPTISPSNVSIKNKNETPYPSLAVTSPTISLVPNNSNATSSSSSMKNNTNITTPVLPSTNLTEGINNSTKDVTSEDNVTQTFNDYITTDDYALRQDNATYYGNLNATNGTNAIIDSPSQAGIVFTSTGAAILPNDSDDLFPNTKSLNDDQIRTNDDYSNINILSTATEINVDKITGNVNNAVDDATSDIASSSRNDVKNDDDPIMAYPDAASTSSRAGANLTFQGYDDGFDDTVHDDAFKVDDTWQTNKNTGSTSDDTVLSSTIVAPEAGLTTSSSSNFDFGKTDDFSIKSDDDQTKLADESDFAGVSSSTSKNGVDDGFQLGGTMNNGDDFQATAMIAQPSNQQQREYYSSASRSNGTESNTTNNTNMTMLSNRTGSIQDDMFVDDNTNDIDFVSSSQNTNTSKPTNSSTSGSKDAIAETHAPSSKPSTTSLTSKKGLKDVATSIPSLPLLVMTYPPASSPNSLVDDYTMNTKSEGLIMTYPPAPSPIVNSIDDFTMDMKSEEYTMNTTSEGYYYYYYYNKGASS